MPKTRSWACSVASALLLLLTLWAVDGTSLVRAQSFTRGESRPAKASESDDAPRMRFAPEREDAPLYQVQRVDPATLVVYRARTGQTGLEGFLLDVPTLLRTLHERVLGDRGLADVAGLTLSDQTSRGRSEGDGYGYQFYYEFSEPFRGVHAQLSLAPLDDTGERRLLMVLASSLALAIVLGLYALYRMSAVQMHFAERRENFVSAVSHELKTPLTAIRMYGEILREGLVDSDEKRSEYYGLISSESERLSRLVQNVLDLSRVERGGGVSDLVVGDVGKVVREAVQVLTPQAAQRGFSIEVGIDSALPSARFSADAVKQVLFNLLDNAFKYARESSDLRVHVRCEACPRGVCLTVRDHGPGVAQADLTRIFEPFYRAEVELTRRHEGVGLGLALVARLVEAMGGTVEASGARPGLSVSIVLPRA